MSSSPVFTHKSYKSALLYSQSDISPARGLFFAFSNTWVVESEQPDRFQALPLGRSRTRRTCRRGRFFRSCGLLNDARGTEEHSVPLSLCDTVLPDLLEAVLHLNRSSAVGRCGYVKSFHNLDEFIIKFTVQTASGDRDRCYAA